VAGCCEPSVSIKGGEFVELLSNYEVLKKDSAPQSWLVGCHYF
jgi:hypothetical protein